MRLSEKDIALKRLQIIEAGTRLMTRQGYAGTGISEIAKEVGMPKGSFFNYFKSKEAFTIELLRAYCEYNQTGMRRRLSNDEIPALERLRRYYLGNAEWHMNKAHYRGGCLLNGLSAEISDHNSTIADVVKECLELLVNEIALCLKEAQDNGELSRDHNADELASFIENSWRGFLTTSKSMKSPIAVDGFIHYVFDVILKS